MSSLRKTPRLEQFGRVWNMAAELSCGFRTTAKPVRWARPAVVHPDQGVAQSNAVVKCGASDCRVIVWQCSSPGFHVIICFDPSKAFRSVLARACWRQPLLRQKLLRDHALCGYARPVPLQPPLAEPRQPSVALPLLSLLQLVPWRIRLACECDPPSPAPPPFARVSYRRVAVRHRCRKSWPLPVRPREV